MSFHSFSARFTGIVLTAFTLVATGSQAEAQMQNLFGNVTSAITGGGGGGNSGNMVLDTYMVSLKTALYNQIIGIALVQEAQGDKSKAASLRATANAMQSMKQASKDTIEKSLKAIDENPINREGLAKVKDADGQKKIAMAEGHMNIASVYDAVAVATGAIALSQVTKGGLASLLNPGVLQAIQITMTTLPAQSENAKKFDEALKAYMAENKVPALSKGEKTALAKKTDPNAAKQAASF